MKKLLFLFAALLFVASGFAKTTYIPTYYAQINVVGADGEFADSTLRRELTYIPKDIRYAITILQDSVTRERVKAIKSAKAASGWAMAASIMSGVSASLNPVRTSWDAVNYMTELGTMQSSAMLSAASASMASDLQKVPVTIHVDNLSDREMVVNDMKRGLTWYIPAKNYIELSVGNPEVNKLRIAYADCKDQKIDYITIQACNYLEKQTIEFEDDEVWGYEARFQGYDSYGNYSMLFSHYEILNKVTFERTRIEDKKEFMRLKEEANRKEKQAKKNGK